MLAADLEDLQAQARRHPAETGRWLPLLEAHRRLGRLEEGLLAVRDLVALARDPPDLVDRFLELMRGAGLGIGDPRLQFPDRVLATRRCCAGRHLQVEVQRHGTWVLESEGLVVRERLAPGPIPEDRHPPAAGRGAEPDPAAFFEGFVRIPRSRAGRARRHARAIDRLLVAGAAPLAFTADLAGGAALWDLGTGRSLATWPAPRGPYGIVELARDGTLVVLAGTRVRLIPPGSTQPARVLGFEAGDAVSASLTAAGDGLAVATRNRELLLLDLGTGALRWRVPVPLVRVVGRTARGIACLVVHQDHTELALVDAATGDFQPGWRVQGLPPAELDPFEGPRLAEPGATWAAALPGTEGLLLLGGGAVSACFPGEATAITGIPAGQGVLRAALAPGRGELALLTEAGRIEVWTTATRPDGTWFRTETLGGDGLPPRDLAYTPDGEHLLYTRAGHLRLHPRPAVAVAGSGDAGKIELPGAGPGRKS